MIYGKCAKCGEEKVLTFTMHPDDRTPNADDHDLCAVCVTEMAAPMVLELIDRQTEQVANALPREMAEQVMIQLVEQIRAGHGEVLTAVVGVIVHDEPEQTPEASYEPPTGFVGYL